VTEPSFDRLFWEHRWTQVLQFNADQVARRPPNDWLVTETAHLQRGRALDAGCGHGAEAIWLATRGWQVTAVDFSRNALAQARLTAEALGAHIAERIDWVEGDLSTWTPQRATFDLVVSLYVHVTGTVEAMIERLAQAVVVGGTLFLVGHRPIDPASGDPTPAAGQLQVSVEAAIATLDPEHWSFVIAEERPRLSAGTGVDAVISARRTS